MDKVSYTIEERGDRTHCVHRITKTPIQKKHWWERQRYTTVTTLVCKDVATESEAIDMMKRDIAAEHPKKVIKMRQYTDKGELHPSHYPM